MEPLVLDEEPMDARTPDLVASKGEKTSMEAAGEGKAGKNIAEIKK